MEMKPRAKKIKTRQIIDANSDNEEADSITIDPHAYEEPSAPYTHIENNSNAGSVATLFTDTEEVKSVPSVKQGERNFGSMFLRSLAKQNRVIPVDGETDVRPSSAPLQNRLFKPRDQLEMLQRPQTAAAMNTSFSCNIQPKMESKLKNAQSRESIPESHKTSDAGLQKTQQISLQSELNEVAYIPYEYAQSMISRMVNDMKNMKTMHLEVMYKIEDQYKCIEKESQRQFSLFVTNLQNTYKERINVFRANMGRLNVEMKNNKAQHASTMQSLKSKNKQLLNEKVKVLQAQKSDFKAADKPQAQYFKESTKAQSVIEQNKLDIDYDGVVPVPAPILVKTDDSESDQSILENDHIETTAEEKQEEGDLEKDKPEMLPDFDEEQDQNILDKEEDKLETEFEEEKHGEYDSFEEQEIELNEANEVDIESEAQSDKEELIEEDGEEDVQIEFNSGVVVEKGSSQIVKGAIVSKTLREKEALKALDKVKAQLVKEKQKSTKNMKQIKELELKLKNQPSSPQKSVAAVDIKEIKKLEKRAKDLEKKLELESKKASRDNTLAVDLDLQIKAANKQIKDLTQQLASKDLEFANLTVAAETGAIAIEKVESLSNEVKSLNLENQTLVDNYNTERVLRKKYYNMVEDMKGKIRVYCRVRPLSKTEKGNKNQYAVQSPDDYTVKIMSTKGTKEFQFDSIFTEDHGQSTVFEDTNMLIQSAVDGYNVCIFAYGQTGSGKTYTMIGDTEQKSPGIAPRAFERIFDLVEKNKNKFSFVVSCYMLELYNEKLIDLLAHKSSEPAKLDIKKDNKGMVFINGATICEATDSDNLFSIFSKGSESRHTASTKMNAESSRSHLIIGVVIESTNLTSGAVIKGKLSLVDLAGSERVGKTGATAQQLKEANSINKSLSALGDVISALSSDQGFIPYRNNKLTMLMQDSLGGNAKTLMFVNISPADYNTDESIISLTYASRVKLITNDASKNAESKEVAKLKQIIAKLKAGEDVDDLMT